MSVLITGGAGFIGSHLARRLVKEGYRVTIIDNLSEGKLENIKDFKSRIKFYQKDILNLTSLKEISRKVDFIFHLAAIRSILKSIKNPLATMKVNIEGTLNVLLAARENRVKRVIFASSSSVYGKQKAKILTETLCPNPLSPYALSKLAGEFSMKQFYLLYGLETISLRYFNVFGPFQDPNSKYATVIPIFIKKMLTGQRPTIYWDGNQSRDFTYVDDVVEASVLAMQAKKTSGETINISMGKTISINQVFRILNQIIGTDLLPIRNPKRPADLRRAQGDIILARRILKFEAKVSFEEGLKRTIDWFQNYPSLR